MSELKFKSLIFLRLSRGSFFNLSSSAVNNVSRRLFFTSKSFFELESSGKPGVLRGKSSFVVGRNILKLRDLGLLQSVLPRNRYVHLTPIFSIDYY